MYHNLLGLKDEQIIIWEIENLSYDSKSLQDAVFD